LPPASSRIALHIAIIGREIPRPSNSASKPPSRKPPAATMMINRAVSPTIALDSASSRCRSEITSAFIAPAPFTIAAAESAISATNSSISLGILDQFGQGLATFVEQRAGLF
jgi:hypothetical protein